MQKQPDAPLVEGSKRIATPRRRRSDHRRLNVKGLILSAATGATTSLLGSLVAGKLDRTEMARAALATAIAALAFAQPRRFPPIDPPLIRLPK